MNKEIETKVEEANKVPISNASASKKMDEFNTMLEGYGVEPITRHGYFDRYFGDARLLYVNLGDMYLETVFLDTDKNHFFISDFERVCKRFKL